MTFIEFEIAFYVETLLLFVNKKKALYFSVQHK